MLEGLTTLDGFRSANSVCFSCCYWSVLHEEKLSKKVSGVVLSSDNVFNVVLFELEAPPPSKSSSSRFSSSSSYLTLQSSDSYRVLRVVYFLILLFLVLAYFRVLPTYHSGVRWVMVLGSSRCRLK
jgi:hypothetical protein